MDSTKRPHISYISSSYGTLHYAFKDSSDVWQLVEAPSAVGAVTAAKTSISIDSNGDVYIGYQDNGIEVVKYRK